MVPYGIFNISTMFGVREKASFVFFVQRTTTKTHIKPDWDVYLEI